MAQFTSIHHIPTYMEIVQQICDNIRNDALSPGTKLPPERALAQQFGIGRQCLREAFSVLAVLGVVEVRKSKGVFVTATAPLQLQTLSLNNEELGAPFELMEARILLEPKITGLAAVHRDQKMLADLDRILEEMTLRLKDGEHCVEQDKCFHMTIANGCGNGVFARLLSVMITNMGKRLWRELKEKSLHVPGRSARYLKEHVEITESIRSGNKQLATSHMRNHLKGVARDSFCA